MANIKNQINSYISDVTKKYLTNYFVFIGGITNQDNIVEETDITYLSKITKDEVSVVVPKKVWEENSTYEPYIMGSSGNNTYVLNYENMMLYLCVGKNQPDGLIGDQEYKSTVQPQHGIGIQTLADGYSWLALHSIEGKLSDFINSTSIPVNNLYDFRADIQYGSFTSKYTSICRSSLDSTGKCYFYYTRDEYDPAKGGTVLKDTVVSGIPADNWYCSTCHEVADKLGYKSYFLSNDNKESIIERDSLKIAKTQVDSLLFPKNGTIYTQQKNYEYVENLNGTINNLQLDVSNLTAEERIVSSQEPEITILDSKGIGASAKIKTYYDSVRNAFIANGINFQNGGSGYINPKFSISAAVSPKLSSSIKAVVINPLFVADPSTILPTPRVSVVKSFNNADIVNSGTSQTSFYKIGIVSNVLDTNGVDISTGTISGEKKELRNSTTIELNTSSSVPSLSVGEVFISDTGTARESVFYKNSSQANSNSYVSKLVATKSKGSNTILEFTGSDEFTVDYLSNLTKMEIDSTLYSVVTSDASTIKTDNLEYITVKTLNKPINIVNSDSYKKNTFILNFII